MSTRTLATVMGLGLVIALVALTWRQTIPEPLKVSGFLEADEIRVGSRVGGRVKEVLVREGHSVTAGSILVRIEPYDLQERLAEAKADLAAKTATHRKMAQGYRREEKAKARADRDHAQALFAEAEAGPRQQEKDEGAENVKLAESELKLAESNLKRTEELYNRKATPREEYERVLTQAQVARQALAVRRVQMDKLREGTRKEQREQAKAKLAGAEAESALRDAGFRPEEVSEAEAMMTAATARVAAMETQIAELEIKAPIESYVEAIDLQPGDLVGANVPVITLIDHRRLWVRAYIPENRLGWAQLGAKLPVLIDSFPGERIAAEVIFVARDAEFTPGNVQTPEDRGRQVYRIKVEIRDHLDRLRPGMAADILLEPVKL